MNPNDKDKSMNKMREE